MPAIEWVATDEITERVDSFIGQVIDTRHRTPAHPMTNAIDGLLFAHCEDAEVDDAQIRLDPRYIRNNSKDIDPEMEIGDTIYMIVSSIMAIQAGDYGPMKNREGWAKAEIGRQIAESRAWMHYGNFTMAHIHAEMALRVLIYYCDLAGIDAQACLDKSKAKFLRKFGEKKDE